jgi:hypothetical protein
MNSISITNGTKKRYQFNGKGSITFTLPKGTKIETEIVGAHQQLILRSAIVHKIRRGPNSSIELKGTATFDALKNDFSPTAVVVFRVDKKATMSVSASRDKASFNLKLVL